MARTNLFSNGINVIGGKGRGRLICGFQQPIFQFRRHLKWLLLLVTDRANDVIHKFADIRANAATDLLLQEFFNIAVK